jgi:hypothetical protein
MTIAALADYNGALRERVRFAKTAARSMNANRFAWWTLWDATGGTPAAGTLNVGNTANGLVPTDATTGAPPIVFGSGTGYLTEVIGQAGALGRAALYDRLFHAGAYAFNAATSLASQPSYSSRVPGGNYDGTELWIECVTSNTGSQSVAVTYTNQAGTAAQSTGTFVAGTMVAGEMIRLPLQAGDSGVQKVESVTGTVASAGTFNVLVTRPLWKSYFPLLGTASATGPAREMREWLTRTNMPIVFGDSCLAMQFCYYQPNTAATPQLDFEFEVASA